MEEIFNALIQLLKRIKRFGVKALTRCFVLLFRALPVRQRVFFYTIRSDGRLLENAQSVYEAFDGETVVFAKMLPHSFWQGIRVRHLLLTSRVIVTDDYLKYLRDTHLRPGQKVVQLWHALGALKRFGLDAPSLLTEAEERATHNQYSVVCVSSEAVRPFYAGAFGVPLALVQALGAPRTDALLDETKRAETCRKLFARCPELKGKTVYLYLPTFREQGGAPLSFDPQIDFAALEKALYENEMFVVSRHPVMKEPFFRQGAFSKVLDLSDVPTGELLCSAAAIATDYSSVIFDAALLHVPPVFYCPDLDSYEREFYLDFQTELPGELTKDPAELLPLLRRAAEQPQEEKLQSFCRKQAGACDGRSTERIVHLIQSYFQ